MGAKQLFEAGRLSYDLGYLKPSKRLLVDLAVSPTGLDKALAFANDLFLACEASGHRVTIAPESERFHRAPVDEREKVTRNENRNELWSPYRCTVVYIGTLAIGLTIIELSEEVDVRYVNGKYVRESEYVAPKRSRYVPDHTWTTKKRYPTGRLLLQAYSPYPRANWMKQWREVATGELQRQIGQIVTELEAATSHIAKLVEEGERQAEIERKRWEAQQRQWEREEAARQVAQARKQSLDELVRLIEAWTQANQRAQFFADAERRAADLPDADRIAMLERVKLARDLIGTVNALDHLRKWKAPSESLHDANTSVDEEDNDDLA